MNTTRSQRHTLTYIGWVFFWAGGGGNFAILLPYNIVIAADKFNSTEQQQKQILLYSRAHKKFLKM